MKKVRNKQKSGAVFMQPDATVAEYTSDPEWLGVLGDITALAERHGINESTLTKKGEAPKECFNTKLYTTHDESGDIARDVAEKLLLFICSDVEGVTVKSIASFCSTAMVPPRRMRSLMHQSQVLRELVEIMHAQATSASIDSASADPRKTPLAIFIAKNLSGGVFRDKVEIDENKSVSFNVNIKQTNDPKTLGEGDIIRIDQ